MSAAALPIQLAGPAIVDAAQRSAALDVKRSFLVEAPAGSGKTGLLVQRLLRLLCLVDKPESVLALTFTNKATAEMRERVLNAFDLVPHDPATLSEFDRETRAAAAALLAHDRALGWQLRQNSHRLNVRTIDSLCGEIARSLPLSSNAVGQMTPVEDPAPLYHRAARSVMLRLGGQNAVLNDAWATVLLRRDANLQNCETLLAGMLATREQWLRLIPLTPEELTDEYLDGEVKPTIDRALQAILCAQLTRLQETFPAPELQELTELASKLARADGIDGAPNPIGACAGRTRVPGAEAIDVEHWTMLAHLLLTQDGWRKSGGITDRNLKFAIKPHKHRLVPLLEHLASRDGLHERLCELRNLPPSTMPAEDWHVTKALFHLLHFARIDLQTIFQEGNVCDFTERSIAARAALTHRAPREALADMDLQHVLVDEMQDTSSAQYELLEALTAGWDGQRRTVFLVGDPKQSIYLFRQARVERFVGSLHEGRLGTVPLDVLRLATNFRSAAPLVDAFNGLFAPVFAYTGGGIDYTFAAAATSALPGALHWHVEPVLGDVSTDERRASRTAIRKEQAEHIVRTIHGLRAEAAPGKPPSIAVLVRSREHAAQITRLLQESSIPFRGVELQRLGERPEVLDALAVTRAVLHPADRVAWLAVLRAPWCGATLAELHNLADGEERGSGTRAPRTLFRERLLTLPEEAQHRVLRTLDVLDAAVGTKGRMPLAELVERTLRALGTGLFRSAAQNANVQRYLELLEEVEAELLPVEAVTLHARVADLYAAADTTPGAVDVMTIHKAKGLEWDVVFVPEVQRSTGGNGQRLLDWMEVTDDTTGQAGVLLAPIPPRGYKTAELGCYVQTMRRRQEEAEVARLLYVVITRARQQVHLYAAPELKKDTDEVTRRRGTLLAAAWPGAGEIIQARAVERKRIRSRTLQSISATADESNDRAERELADLRRVPQSFDPALLQPPFTAPWMQVAPDTSSPAFETVIRPEGTLASRTLGNTVHLFLDLLAERAAASPNAGVAELLTEIQQWPARIRAILRDAGTPGTRLQQDTETVLQALRNTLTDPLGRWLLQPHPSAATEQALTDEGTGRALRLDRSFLAGPTTGSAGDSTLWIVDYKTAAPTEGLPFASFLLQERERYAPQLRNYARLRAAQPGAPQRIMLALYYPLLPALDAWPLEDMRIA